MILALALYVFGSMMKTYLVRFRLMFHNPRMCGYLIGGRGLRWTLEIFKRQPPTNHSKTRNCDIIQGQHGKPCVLYYFLSLVHSPRCSGLPLSLQRHRPFRGQGRQCTLDGRIPMPNVDWMPAHSQRFKQLQVCSCCRDAGRCLLPGLQLQASWIPLGRATHVRDSEQGERGPPDRIAY